MHKSDDGAEPVSKISSNEEELLGEAVLKLSGNVWGLVIGILLGLTVFVATNFLILKGGAVVGPHLGLLSQFFIGYSVTFVGSLIGFGYGLLCGYIAGFVIVWIYNHVVGWKRR